MTLPRCPVPGCPHRWRSGEDRRCREHARDEREAAVVARADQALAVEQPDPAWMAEATWPPS